MRVRILSDLHLEFAPFAPPLVDADVIILAGDVHNGVRGLQWIDANFPDVPVLYVLGNHEFYGDALPSLTSELKTASEGSNVHVLENDCVEIGGVAFMGATLWTDFALFGDPVIGGLAAESGMNDFRKIKVTPGYSRLGASELRRIHADSVLWLGQQFEIRGDQRKVVITHHAPSPRSIPPRFQGDGLNPAFASNLDELVAKSGAAIWVHGHIHTCSDYMIGDTRVIANPRGYPGESVGAFDPALVIEV